MKLTIQSSFVKIGEDVKNEDLIKFLTEGEEKMSEKFKKENVVIGVLTRNGQKLLTLNNSSKKNMMSAYGDDTEDWIGKEARVNIVRQMVGSELKNVLILTHPNKDIDGNNINE